MKKIEFELVDKEKLKKGDFIEMVVIIGDDNSDNITMVGEIVYLDDEFIGIEGCQRISKVYNRLIYIRKAVITLDDDLIRKITSEMYDKFKLPISSKSDLEMVVRRTLTFIIDDE